MLQNYPLLLLQLRRGNHTSVVNSYGRLGRRAAVLASSSYTKRQRGGYYVARDMCMALLVRAGKIGYGTPSLAPIY
jgi:hypothetical protein